MRPGYLLFMILYIMYCDQYDIVFGKSMFGPNVRDANDGEFPYIVSIRRINVEHPDPFEDHICTASIITRQDVLSAAHCVEDEVLQNVQVIIGSVDIRNGTGYNVSWWITYNEWAAHIQRRLLFRRNDIATFRLTQLVPENIDIGVLSHLPVKDFYGAQVVMAAWGQNELSILPEIMRTVELTVNTNAACRATIKRLTREKVKLHSRHLCTSANPHAVLYWGDSGGPLLHMGMIIAVHKCTMPFPNDPLNPRNLNIHTTISYYRDFITAVINPDFHGI